MFWNQYPYINLNDLNLDYLLNKLKALEVQLVDFIKINTIKYADPIQWNITTQYETNTVVIDGNTGTAYLSTQPVPSGVVLTNSDYWTVIFTLDILSANQNITFRNDGANVLATFESNINDWLLWNGQLYKVIRHIATNEAYVAGYNLVRYSVELFIKDYIANLENIIGALSDLTTINKNSIVSAINEVNEKPITTPEAFGAVGDGVTDDTQAFVDAMSFSKQIELVNGSNYKIGVITIPNGTTINGNDATITATIDNCITLNDDVTLNDIVFTDNLTTLEIGSGYLVGASDKTKIHIEHCHFNDVHIAACIRLSHCDNCTIEHNLLEHYSYSGIMFAHTCSYMKVNFNKVYDGRGSFVNRYPICISGYSDNADYGTAHHIECCYNDIEDLTPVWEGIDSHGVNDCHIAFNNIKNTVDGIAFTAPSGGFSIPTNANNVVIENNVIDVVRSGIGINANEIGNVSKNVIVRNNDVKCTNTDAVQAIARAGIFALFYELNGLLIENNTVNSNKHGITVQHFGGTNIKVSNNKITSGNTSGNYGLWLDFHTSYNQTVIDNNNFVGGDKYFRGPGVTGGNNSLIKIVNARFATTKADNIDYTDFKRATAPSSATRAAGSNGDYIPCVDSSGGVAGWYCVNPSRWFEINLGNELS